MTVYSGHSTTAARQWTATRPKLLVSVRSVVEAHAAIDGGADIIDVKEPAAGALGMAAPVVIEAIANLCAAAGVPCSAALGELPERCGDRSGWRLSGRLSWAKVGLASCLNQPQWPVELQHIWNERLAITTGRIAVAYVDADRAAAPSVSQVAEIALELGCAGLLLDTWDKSGGGLLQWLSPAELAPLCARMQSAGLFVAAAGRLAVDDLPAVIDAGASIIAVRSAVCAGYDRQAMVTQEGVAQFRARW